MAVALAPKQLLADIERGKARPVYCLFGEEPFKITELEDKIRQLLES